jgi:hypothetical protein
VTASGVGLLVESRGNVIVITADSEAQIKSVIASLSLKYACCRFNRPVRNDDGSFSTTGSVGSACDVENKWS